MKVEFSRTASKSLSKVPAHIKTKLLGWVDLVEKHGIYEARKSKGYHDEPLKGEKSGLRSIRLSGKWRAEYSERLGVVELIVIEEVHAHAHKK